LRGSPVGRTAMFILPHREAQLILPAEQLSGSPLRFAQQWFDESSSR
jgi:hypothetical protein